MNNLSVPSSRELRRDTVALQQHVVGGGVVLFERRMYAYVVVDEGYLAQFGNGSGLLEPIAVSSAVPSRWRDIFATYIVAQQEFSKRSPYGDHYLRAAKTEIRLARQRLSEDDLTVYLSWRVHVICYKLENLSEHDPEAAALRLSGQLMKEALEPRLD